jgi:large subunit ribosomal protein L10
MRIEKEFLATEVSKYLDNTNYTLLVEYTRLTVAEVTALRKKLMPLNAKFHVVKGSIFGKVAIKHNLPDMSSMLNGQVAVVVGGDDVASIVKTLEAFFKEKEKGALKGALFYGKIVEKDRMAELRNLPTMAEARAQFLALLNTPATTLVRLIGTPSQQFVNVVEAYVRKNGAAA